MKKYTGKSLDLISYPLGGIGAGMICIEGTGSIGSISIKNVPDFDNEPLIYSALTIKGKRNISRVLEGPVPGYKVFTKIKDSGNGLPGTAYGLPRFSNVSFESKFPFADIQLEDEDMPVRADIRAWSPFIPNDEAASGMPFAAVEYTFTNITDKSIEAVYYFSSIDFIRSGDNSSVKKVENGFVFIQDGTEEAPYQEASFAVSAGEKAFVDTALFRGGWFDTPTMLWKNIENGKYNDKEYPDPEKGRSMGASLAIPFCLGEGESKTVRLRLCWYVPRSNLRFGKDDEGCCDDGACCKETYIPWYATKLGSIDDAVNMWESRYDELLMETQKFTDCFYSSDLPEEIMDAVAANLSILKSPTILRQQDGRIWGWEGCNDCVGCCSGSCTHVWNYAQSLCHLFPGLERTLRQTEFNEMQDEETGHQNFRAYLPIRKAQHTFHAASDGQLGGILKVYRDWKIKGDDCWLLDLWPKITKSLDFCIRTWDKKREGVLKEPHHNTYDIEFWGADGMCSSFYISALKAAYEMSEVLCDARTDYLELYNKGREYLQTRLFNGEYFIQQVEYETLEAAFDYSNDNSETKLLLEKEGPKYQYGSGCLSDGVIGFWLAKACGLEDVIDEEMLKKNLLSIYKYNFKSDLSAHANTQRPGFAFGKEGGLVLCTWPKGDKPSLPFIYSEEVWTGIEYQVAAHLISNGFVKEGLDIVRACRNRYNGTIRNPFNEYECGHWYARAMASYSLIWAYTGIRYDNRTKTLYASTKSGKDYRAFLSTDTGYGIVELKDGFVNLNTAYGIIEVKEIVIRND